MRPIKSFGERIADALVEDGLLSTRQVEELLELQKKEGTRLLKLILEKSYVGEVDMIVSMGRVLNVPPVNLSRIGIPAEIAGLVPREMATNHKVLPVSRLDNKPKEVSCRFGLFPSNLCQAVVRACGFASLWLTGLYGNRTSSFCSGMPLSIWIGAPRVHLIPAMLRVQ